jgi:pyruvate dehydrogenase E2 component (dihydrolipoamide acetyltransferase)
VQAAFKLPDVGEGIHEAEVVRWLVQPGDRVTRDQPVVEVQTDKALVELPTPYAGRVVSLGAQPGDMVPVGATLFVVDDESGPAEPEPTGQAAGGSAAPAAAFVRSEAPAGGRVLATPAVRRLARELGVDLSQVRGSGEGGRVLAEDVREAAQRAARAGPSAPAAPTFPAPAAAPPAPEPVAPAGVGEEPGPSREALAPAGAEVERIPLRGLRRAIARHMVKSMYTAPHVTSFERCEVSALVALRGRLKPLAAERGVTLTYLPFVIKAVVSALKAHPWVNASVDDEREEIVVHREYHIGVATATPEGLVVPVVRHADRLSLFELAAEVERLGQAARERTATREELSGSTFTITNYGAYGGSWGTPIINHPEVAILGLGQIRPEPWVRDGELVVGQILPLSLSFDHRIIDGELAHRFLSHVIARLSEPDRLILDV